MKANTKIQTFLSAALIAVALSGAISCRNNSRPVTLQDICRLHITVPDNLARKDSGAVYLCSHMTVLDTLQLRDTVIALKADSTECLALIWEYPGINAGTDRFFLQFIPESGTVTIRLDSATVSGAGLNSRLTAFAKRVSDAVGEYDNDYARDICADTFRENPRNAVGLQALYFCINDFRPDEIKAMMKEAGLSRKEREKLMENPIIKGYFTQNDR